MPRGGTRGPSSAVRRHRRPRQSSCGCRNRPNRSGPAAARISRDRLTGKLGARGAFGHKNASMQSVDGAWIRPRAGLFRPANAYNPKFADRIVFLLDCSRDEIGTVTGEPAPEFLGRNGQRPANPRRLCAAFGSPGRVGPAGLESMCRRSTSRWRWRTVRRKTIGFFPTGRRRQRRPGAGRLFGSGFSAIRQTPYQALEGGLALLEPEPRLSCMSRRPEPGPQTFSPTAGSSIKTPWRAGCGAASGFLSIGPGPSGSAIQLPRRDGPWGPCRSRGCLRAHLLAGRRPPAIFPGGRRAALVHSPRRTAACAAFLRRFPLGFFALTRTLPPLCECHRGGDTGVLDEKRRPFLTSGPLRPRGRKLNLRPPSSFRRRPARSISIACAAIGPRLSFGAHGLPSHGLGRLERRHEPRRSSTGKGGKSVLAPAFFSNDRYDEVPKLAVARGPIPGPTVDKYLIEAGRFAGKHRWSTGWDRALVSTRFFSTTGTPLSAPPPFLDARFDSLGPSWRSSPARGPRDDPFLAMENVDRQPCPPQMPRLDSTSRSAVFDKSEPQSRLTSRATCRCSREERRTSTRHAAILDGEWRSRALGPISRARLGASSVMINPIKQPPPRPEAGRCLSRSEPYGGAPRRLRPSHRYRSAAADLVHRPSGGLELYALITRIAFLACAWRSIGLFFRAVACPRIGPPSKESITAYRETFLPHQPPKQQRAA